MNCNYPAGHPEFIDQPNTTDISKFYGLVKCKFLPVSTTTLFYIQTRVQTLGPPLQDMCAKRG